MLDSLPVFLIREEELEHEEVEREVSENCSSEEGEADSGISDDMLRVKTTDSDMS